MTVSGLPTILAIGALLAAVLAAEIVGDRPAVVAGSGKVVSSTAAMPPPAGIAARVGDDGARLDTILARPLFNPDRRPLALPAADGGRAVAGLPRLAGILVTPSGRTAIFAAADGGKPIVVLENGRVGAYVVYRIEGGTVTLTGPDGQRQIRPSFASGAEAAAYSSQALGAQSPIQPGFGQLPSGPPVSGLALIRNPPNLPSPAAPPQ